MENIQQEVPRVVQDYIQRVLKIPKITQEEERKLFIQWKRKKAEKARNRILLSNLRYVVAIALNYRSYPVSVEDLISEGNLGLLVAFDKYQKSIGTRFITYAAYWVRAYMLNFIMRSYLGGKTGSGPFRSKYFFKLRRERARDLCLYGSMEKTYEETGRRIGLTGEKVARMVDALESFDISLDSPVRHFDGTASIGDFFKSSAPDPEEKVMELEKGKLLKQILKSSMDLLDSREKFIIEKRILDDEKHSLADLGRILGVSRERARQLESRAKKKIKNGIENSGFRDFDLFS